jgi:tRNA G18 (ribose-2'-O)-methylase SpoU
MKKLKLEQLQRISVEEFRNADKIPVSVILNDVRSMLNVGSIFRSCDAFRIEKLYLCGITGRPPHRDIQKTALGATESVDWEYREDALALCRELKEEGILITGIEQTSGSVLLPKLEVKAGQRYALILGNEVEGISNELLPELQLSVEIPQGGTKHSLNVAVAAGIVLYKFYELVGIGT